MSRHGFWNEEYLLWETLALSLGLHFLLLHAGTLTFHFHEKHTVEIDITNMGHLGSVLSAPKKATPPAPPRPAVKQKQWTQPRPDQKVVPAAIPTQPVPAPVPEPLPASVTASPANGEYGIGTGEGGESQLSRLPQLLNLSDLGAILKRFYPEHARVEHREGTVVLDLHIDGEGHVMRTDVVQSGGSDFDAAAQRVAQLLRFTPAFLGSQRVGVKMRQAIRFKLEQ